jgi:hypothetical protein
MNETTKLAIQETIDSLIDGLKNKPMETMIFIVGGIGSDARNDFNLYMCSLVRYCLGDNSACFTDNAGLYQGLCNLVCQIIKQERNLIVLPEQVYEFLESKEG